MGFWCIQVGDSFCSVPALSLLLGGSGITCATSHGDRSFFALVLSPYSSGCHFCQMETVAHCEKLTVRKNVPHILGPRVPRCRVLVPRDLQAAEG
jgi:hypothetical protein